MNTQNIQTAIEKMNSNAQSKINELKLELENAQNELQLKNDKLSKFNNSTFQLFLSKTKLIVDSMSITRCGNVEICFNASNFKTIKPETFRGYDKNGAYTNRKRITEKSEKFDNMFTMATGMKCNSNEYSFMMDCNRKQFNILATIIL